MLAIDLARSGCGGGDGQSSTQSHTTGGQARLPSWKYFNKNTKNSLVNVIMVEIVT